MKNVLSQQIFLVLMSLYNLQKIFITQSPKQSQLLRSQNVALAAIVSQELSTIWSGNVLEQTTVGASY